MRKAGLGYLWKEPVFKSHCLHLVRFNWDNFRITIYIVLFSIDNSFIDNHRNRRGLRWNYLFCFFLFVSARLYCSILNSFEFSTVSLNFTSTFIFLSFFCRKVFNHSYFSHFYWQNFSIEEVRNILRTLRGIYSQHSLLITIPRCKKGISWMIRAFDSLAEILWTDPAIYPVDFLLLWASNSSLYCVDDEHSRL